jgi:hypothetical protein
VIRTATTWSNGQFNVDQAESIHSSSASICYSLSTHLICCIQTDHADINLSNPTSTSKSSTSVGAIAGGVVGGVVGAVLIAVAIYLYLRRKRRMNPRRQRKLVDPHPETKVHGRSMSDMSQKVTETTTNPDRYSGTPSTVYSARSPIQTTFGSGNHSLPYDVSLITSMGNTPSPPPQPMQMPACGEWCSHGKPRERHYSFHIHLYCGSRR